MPRTSRPLQILPIVLRRAEVARIVDVSPNMRRVTLTGEDLLPGTMGDGFERPPFRSEGFDDHVKLVIPPANGELPHIGTQEETRFAWNSEAFAYTRDYTVRSWDPDANTFEVDVARHDHGPAAAWAWRAQPGDEIHFAGPKSCALVNKEAEWHLLVGDETALPAIGRWLEEASAGTRGHVIVEVPTVHDRQEIVTKADVEIEWLVREDTPAGASTQLFDAVKGTEVPSGRVYAWCAGEAMTIAPIRRYLRRDLGLPKEDVEVVGYWRRPATEPATKPGTSQDDEHDPVPAAPDGREDGDARGLLHEVHEMTELAPPIVTRVAVTLNVGLLIGSGVTTLDGLSRETGVEQARLQVLLDAMAALDLVGIDANGYYNTARGGVLMEASASEALSLDNPANREALALVDLLDVLRSGRPAARSGAGGGRGRRAADPELDAAFQDRNAEALHYVLDPISRLAPVAGASKLAVFGDAASRVVSHVERGRTVQLIGNGAEESWPAHDCAVLICALEGRSDGEALGVLAAALAAGPAVVIAERMADKAATDDHVAEYALTSLAFTGSPLRTSDRIGDLLRKAGARSVETQDIGWGFGPFGNVILAYA